MVEGVGCETMNDLDCDSLVDRMDVVSMLYFC